MVVLNTELSHFLGVQLIIKTEQAVAVISNVRSLGLSVQLRVNNRINIHNLKLAQTLTSTLKIPRHWLVKVNTTTNKSN